MNNLADTVVVDPGFGGGDKQQQAGPAPQDASVVVPPPATKQSSALKKTSRYRSRSLSASYHPLSGNSHQAPDPKCSPPFAKEEEEQKQ